MSTVLIVDDESPIREFLSRWLQAANHRTMEAADADAALALVSIEQPDVVLCDVHMPGHDGIWLMEQLHNRFPQVAIVLATASEEVPPAISMRRGVVEYLVKPFDRRSVLAAVSHAFEWRQRESADAAKHDRDNTLNEWLKGGRA